MKFSFILPVYCIYEKKYTYKLKAIPKTQKQLFQYSKIYYIYSIMNAVNWDHDKIKRRQKTPRTSKFTQIISNLPPPPLRRGERDSLRWRECMKDQISEEQKTYYEFLQFDHFFQKRRQKMLQMIWWILSLSLLLQSESPWWCPPTGPSWNMVGRWWFSSPAWSSSPSASPPSSVWLPVWLNVWKVTAMSVTTANIRVIRELTFLNWESQW